MSHEDDDVSGERVERRKSGLELAREQLARVQTAWFDPVSREALKTTARATIDLRLTLEGFPGADQVGEIRLLGTLDSRFDNLTPASTAPN